MRLRCADGILIRKAAEGDEEQIAELLLMASGDMLSFILKGVDPSADALRIYREMISEESGIFSLQNCLVAESGRCPIAVANAFPARMIESQLEDVRLTEREEFLRLRIELNDPRSYLLNNIAVAPEHRRLGIGSLLLEAVIAEAKQKALSCVTLHVWADNSDALAFYRSFGFRIARKVAIPWHRDLPHVGGSLLLRLNLPTLENVRQG